MSDDVRLLKSVKGIGPKAAQRIILELRDKVVGLTPGPSPVGDGSADTSQSLINKEVRDEAVGALTMLGFSPAPSSKVVNEILTKNPELPVEMVVKQALKMIK